jgi:hypothetical protein
MMGDGGSEEGVRQGEAVADSFCCYCFFGSRLFGIRAERLRGGGKEGIERKRGEQGIGVCVGVGEWERWAGKGEGRVDNVALGI